MMNDDSVQPNPATKEEEAPTTIAAGLSLHVVSWRAHAKDTLKSASCTFSAVGLLSFSSCRTRLGGSEKHIDDILVGANRSITDASCEVTFYRRGAGPVDNSAEEEGLFHEPTEPIGELSFWPAEDSEEAATRFALRTHRPDLVEPLELQSGFPNRQGRQISE